MRSGDREVPYSLVTAIDLQTIVPGVASAAPSSAGRPIARAADRPQRLDGARSRRAGRRSADARLLRLGRAGPSRHAHGRLPGRRHRADRRAPPPIAISRRSIPASPIATRSATGIRRFRSICAASGRVDEDYWKQYRTTPKAFIPLEVGQRLWRSRYGDRTSVRVAPAAGESLGGRARSLRRRGCARAIDPLAIGLSVQRRARARAWPRRAAPPTSASTSPTSASSSSSSALLLAALFFRLGVEQRAREVGLLRAVGFTHRRGSAGCSPPKGCVLAAIGSADRHRRRHRLRARDDGRPADVVGRRGRHRRAHACTCRRRRWLRGAVGAVVAGDGLHLVDAARAVADLRAQPARREMLAGDDRVPAGRGGAIAIAAGRRDRVRRCSGLALMAARAAGAVDRTGAFFGAGSVAARGLPVRRRVHAAASRSRRPLGGHGWWAVVPARPAQRRRSSRPQRARDRRHRVGDVHPDLGRRVPPRRARRRPIGTRASAAIALLVELLLPIAHDPNGRDGREALGTRRGVDDVAIEPFRAAAGRRCELSEPVRADATRASSAPSRPFIESGRFAFQASLAASDAERANPWLLLNRRSPATTARRAGDRRRELDDLRAAQERSATTS